MSQLVVKSPHKNVPLFRRSIFTHILGIVPDKPDLVGGFPAASPAFIDAVTGAVLTRGALRSLALQFAYSLHNLPEPLVPPSNAPSPHTILIFSPNNIVWPVLLHGTAAAGFRATLANSAYTATELAYQYINAGAHFVFTHPTLVHVVQDALKSVGCTESDIRARVVVVTSQWLTGVADPASTSNEQLTRLDAFLGRGTLSSEVGFDGERSNETLYLCLSSGTTGKPKGVETTHYNLTSLVDIVRPAWPKMTPCRTPSLPGGGNGPQPDVFFGSVPYYHMYGAIKLLLFPLSLGTPTVIMSGFDPARFCEAVERYRTTFVMVVPPMLVVLARHDAVEKYNLSSIRILLSGAAPLGQELVTTIRKRLQKVGANVVVTQAYGLTETSPTMTFLHPDDANAHIGSVGRIMPNLEVRLVREDAGEMRLGRALCYHGYRGAGEIWVRGLTVMKGYLNDPSATASAITPDGWFKTGDVAICDVEGFLTIVDRRKELIKYKGFQVPPAELEALLLRHPDIADAAVIGVESKEEATELPRAYIVPTRPIVPSETVSFALEVQAWAASRTAPHKKLRGGIVIVQQIPKSASGKILRRELRERSKGEVGHGQMMPRSKL